MEDAFKSFIKVSEEDVRPGDHRLSLTIEFLGSILGSYYLPLTLSLSRADSADTSPITFYWNEHPHSRCFILLHHKPDGSLSPIAVDNPELLQIDTRDAPIIDNTGHVPHVYQQQPGEITTCNHRLPDGWAAIREPYQNLSILFTGAVVRDWDQKTIEELVGHQLTGPTARGEDKQLLIPGGAHVSFPIQAEAQREAARPERMHWSEVQSHAACRERERRARRYMSPDIVVKPEDRKTGAPVLSLVPMILHRGDQYDVEFKITYHAADTGDIGDVINKAKTITFNQTELIWHVNNFQLYRKHDDGLEELEDDDEGCGFRLVYDETENMPDIAVTVGSDDQFVDLRPGESWSASRGTTSWPDDAIDGDVFVYAFRGAKVDWWNWGSKEEHAETVVKFGCYGSGPVIEPKDNDGRVELWIPGCEGSEFRYTKPEGEK